MRKSTDGVRIKFGFSYPLIRTKVIFVVIILIFAMIIGFLIASQMYSIVAIIIILILTSFLLIKPRLATALYYASVFVPVGYIHRYFFTIPSIILWFPYFLLLIAIISSLLSTYKESLSKTNSWSHLLVVILWIVIALISMGVNGSSLIAGLLSFRSLFLISGTILLHRINFSIKKQENLLRFILFMGLLMVPVTLFQRIFFAKENPDMVTGLFTAYGDLVFFQIFCILVIISWWINKKKFLNFPSTIITILLFIPLIISNSKAAPLYFFVVMGYMFWLYRRRMSNRVIIGLLAITVIGIVGTFAFDKIYQLSYRNRSAIQSYYTFEGAKEYLMSTRANSEGGLQRGAALLFNFNLIKEKPINLVVGLGPGAVSNSRVPGGTGYIYSRYPNLDLNGNSLSTVVGELGIMGVILLLLLFLSFYKLNNNESIELVVLRKCTALLGVLLLIYMKVLLSFPITLILGVLSIQPKISSFVSSTSVLKQVKVVSK